MSGIRLLTLFTLVGLLAFSCAKPPMISYSVEEPPINQIDPSIKNLILHESYILSGTDELKLRSKLLQKLYSELKKSDRFRVYYYRQNQAIRPVNGKSAVFFGNISSHQAQASGSKVDIITRRSSGRGYSESRDVLERQTWNNQQFQAVLHLHLFEISSEPGLLDDSLSTFAYSGTTIKGNSGTSRSKENRSFLPVNKDKKSEAFEKQQATVHFSPVGSLKTKQDQIVNDLVSQYLGNIMSVKVQYRAELTGTDSDMEKLFRQGKYKLLRNTLNKRVQKAGKSPVAEDLFLLGLTYEAGGENRSDYEEALRLYKQAIQTNPEPPVFYKAVARIERLLNLSPALL